MVFMTAFFFITEIQLLTDVNKFQIRKNIRPIN